MLFILLVIYLILYYIRPAEWVPGIIGSPILMVVGVISILYLGFGVISRRFNNVINGHTERMMFGYFAAMVLSHLSHFYIGGAINSLNFFLPTITGFFLIICYIDSPKRLKFFLLLLITLTTLLAYEGWLQHSTGFSHGGLGPHIENKELLDGQIIQLPRIRWYGVFNDPNDLGLALLLVVPFLLDMLLNRRFILPVLSLPLVISAIYYTNSRGTVLAAIVAIGSYFVIRHRSLFSAMVGVALALLLFLFGPSRMSTISSSEASAYGRIEAWYEAYQMFKDSPLFGVGQGMFTDFHFLTAHNSFVLVMAELGFVGLFFFSGLFYFPYHWLWKNILKNGGIQLSRNDIGLVSAAYASLTGMLAAMFFLSRAYVLLPFMQVALVVALTRVIDQSAQSSSFETVPPKHFKNIFIITVLQIICINFVVKLLI